MKTDYKVGDKVIAVTDGGYPYSVSVGDELEVVEVFSCTCKCRVKDGRVLCFSFREIKPAPKHKYKVGDKVIAVKDKLCFGVYAGDELEVISVWLSGDCSCRTKTGCAFHFDYSDIKPAPKHEYKVGDKVIAVTDGGYPVSVSVGDELEVVEALSCGCNCRVKNGKVLYFRHSEIKPVELSISNSLIKAIKSMSGVTMVGKVAYEDKLIVEFEEEKPVVDDGIYAVEGKASLRIVDNSVVNSLGIESGFKIGLYPIEDFHLYKFTPANDKQRADHMQAEIDNKFWSKLNK